MADLVGGHWPARARAACLAMVSESDEDDADQSMGLHLLSDIQDVFESMSVSFLKSDVLCLQLRGIGEAPWQDIELNPSKLGRRLSEYAIKARHNTAGTERGYRREDFLDAWSRYLPDPDPDTVDEMASEGVRSRA